MSGGAQVGVRAHGRRSRLLTLGKLLVKALLLVCVHVRFRL